MTTEIGIGLLGMGTVGTEVARAIVADNAAFSAAAGRPVRLVAVAVSNLDKQRGVALDGVELSTDPMAVVQHEDVSVVVEVVGGVEAAGRWVSRALELGKPVVTANKALVATDGQALTALAARTGTGLFCEAAAVGAVPIVRAIRASLAGDHIHGIAGILNGTCNYILTQMSEHQTSFADALADAQRLGYAEADPTSDVSGEDAAFKLALLAGFAFGRAVSVADVAISSIEQVSALDIAHAAELGHVIKQVGTARVHDDGSVDAQVAPVLLSKDHPLASVNGAFNAVWLDTERAGDMMLYGRGAGGAPTASAVLGDLVGAIKTIGGPQDALVPAENAQIRPSSEHIGRHYCRIQVVDQPGVLARIAGVFGEHEVSIETFVQKGRDQDPVELVFITHAGRAGNLQAALTEVAALPIVHNVAVCLGLFEDTTP